MVSTVAALIMGPPCRPLYATGVNESPALVKRLVLMGTVLDFWPNTGSPPVSEQDAQFRAALRGGDFEQAMRLFVGTIVTDTGTGELADQLTRNLLRLPQDTVLSVWAADPDVDIRPVLERYRHPRSFCTALMTLVSR